MLIEFKVGNFLSFKDMVTFSMVASPDKEHMDSNVIEVDDKLKLLKSAVLYGANASGKSNLFNAIAFMREFVLKSSKNSQSTDTIDVENFRLSTETDDKPSTFEMIFLIDNIRYRYGFQVDKERVHNEWLFYVPTIREATLFTREEGQIKIGTHFKEGKGLEEKTRDNALFLSVVDQFNGQTAGKIMRWFEGLKILSALHSGEAKAYTLSNLHNEEFLDFTLKFMQVADIGIKNLNIELKPFDISKDFGKELPDSIKDVLSKLDDSKTIEVKSIHAKYDKNNQPVDDVTFKFDANESAGTRALLSLCGPIYFALKNDWVLVVDELTSKLHPLLTRTIINFFHDYRSCKNSERKSLAQLFFTSHDTNILTNQLFRRDQIWFTQKDRYGATDLYSLEEFRVRKDASFNKDYIMGKYGAIPFIGDIESLF